MKKSDTVNGNTLGILGGVILSTDSVWIRLMHIENAWTIVALRGFFMWGVCLLIWAFWRQSRGIIGRPWLTRDNALATLLFCISSACFVNALNRGNVASVLVIISATPFISALISRVFFRIKIERSVMIAALAGMAGVIIVMSGRTETHATLANLYALATAISMALAFIFTARVEGGTAGLPSLGGLLACVLILLCNGAETVGDLKTLTFAQYGWSLAEGALIMPLAMGLISLSTRYVSPASAGLFLLLETALAPVWMALFLGEKPTAQAIIGGILIVAAVILQTLYTRYRAANAGCASSG